MKDQKKFDARKPAKYLGTISLVYPYESNLKILSNPTISYQYYEETFHRSVKIFLTIAQVFGLMPIYGINGPTAASLHYTFCSLRNLYALTIMVAELAHAGIICYWTIKTGCTFDKMFPVLWFTVNPFILYQFVKLARKWSGLMQHWQNFEMTVAHQDVRTHNRMRRIILATSVAIPILACIEHVLSLGNNLNTASHCKNETDLKTAYFTGAFPAYFYFFEVNYGNGIAMQVLNMYATFSWSMTDAFILLVSLGLIAQFRHFNRNFERLKGLHLPLDCLGKQREYFTKLTGLLDLVNTDLATLIVTSFMVNTFYICVQLFESISPSDSTVRAIYFWFSLIYLIGKTFAVTMTATLINDESKKPIKILESLPAAAYGSEASRFMQQLTTGTIALGGMKFFYITRTFLVSMAGTIVTYEIVLMQFKKHAPADYDPCNG